MSAPEKKITGGHDDLSSRDVLLELECGHEVKVSRADLVAAVPGKTTWPCEACGMAPKEPVA